MGHDDGHGRKVHGHVVDGHGLPYFRCTPPPPGMPGADAAMPGVKNNRQPGLGKDFVQRISQAIVGEKLLDGRMKFQSSDLPFGHQALGFLHALRAAMRIDTRKRDGNVGISFSESHHFIVGQLPRLPVSRSSTAKITNAIFLER